MKKRWPSVKEKSSRESAASLQRGVAYGNGKFVAVSTSGAAAYSADGVNWSPATLPAGGGAWYSVTAGAQ